MDSLSSTLLVKTKCLAAAASAVFLSSAALFAQEPVVVRPGAPGQPTKVLPSNTRAKLPPTSRKDVEFMQGMIMHHQQAVEMTALIEDRTKNKDVRLIGARISQSQVDEMNFMKRWLEMRGEPTEHVMGEKSHSAHDSHAVASSTTPSGTTPTSPTTPSAEAASTPPQTRRGDRHPSLDEVGSLKNPTAHLMPGMLTKEQMDALRNAKGAEFDRLFLTGMIQHHNGALVMVRELFDTAGSGQDAELFNFATDVDSGQRAEIKSMQTLLDKNP